MRLVSWNVNRARAKLEQQAEALLGREPDLVALQEVTASTAPVWVELLSARLPHLATSLDHAPLDRQPAGPRRHAPLVATRWPQAPAPVPAVPWPEVIVPVTVMHPDGPFELHSLHVPNSRNGWIKVETLEAVHAVLAAEAPGPRVVCGDFNTPRKETPEGDIVTFARDRYGRLRPERGERWDRAEQLLLTGLRDVGMVDVYRHLHGWETREISWAWPRFPRSGYRLDHVVASLELEPARFEYLHEFRTDGLSDHSPVEVDFMR